MSIDDRLDAAADDLRAVVTAQHGGTTWPDTTELRQRARRRRRRHRALAGAGVALVAIVIAGTAMALRTDRQRVATNVPSVATDPADEIRAAIKVLFEPGHSADDKLAQIDDAHDLSNVITQGMADSRAPNLTLTVSAVDINGDNATAHIDFYIQGALAMKDATLDMVHVGDRWLAQRASYCALSATSGPHCPTTDPATTSGPTTQAIEGVMARTVPVNDHTRHFVPAVAGSPITVSDGGTGTLTAALGVRTDTADYGGQLVFLWHNDEFIGWATSQYGFKLDMRTVDGTSIEVTYGYIKPGEAACCPSGQERVVYHWDGTRVVADHEPPPDIFYGAVELLPS